MPGQDWTVGDHALLVQLRRDGVSIDDVAVKLGRSRYSIKHKIVLLDAATEKRPWTPSELAEVRRLRAVGISRADIAQRIGRSEYAVKHRLAGVTWMCPACGAHKPGSAFGWSRTRPGVPPCRTCRERAPKPVLMHGSNPAPAPRPDLAPLDNARIRARITDVLEHVTSDVTGHRRGTITATTPTKTTRSKFVGRCRCGFVGLIRRTPAGGRADYDAHIKRVRADAAREARVVAFTREVSTGRYRPRSFDEWLARLEDPHTCGTIIRDMIKFEKLKRQPRRSGAGRPSDDYVSAADVLLMPAQLLRVLGLDLEKP